MFANALNNAASRIIAEMIAEQDARKYRASGKSAKSLRYVVRANGFTIYGESYWYQQEYGRKPQSGRVPKWFIQVIKEWARVKGLRSIEKNPFPVAYSVHTKGTKNYRKLREPVGIEKIVAKETAKLETELAAQLAASTIKLFQKNA